LSATHINSQVGADFLTVAYKATGGSFSSVQVMTGTGDDTVGVVGTAAPTSITTGGGGDCVGVAALSRKLGAAPAAPLTIGLGGGANVLRLAEQADVGGDVVAVTATQFLGQGAQPFTVNYSATGGTVAGASLITGSGADQVGVLGTAGPTGIITGAG